MTSYLGDLHLIGLSLYGLLLCKMANVRMRIGDGFAGWPEAGPFDAIIVTAAADKDTGVQINYDETVESIDKENDCFVIKTSNTKYRARSVLLAIGRRGSPRKLEVPGEHLPKVTYRLIEPEQRHDKHVLIVGGGDSALEAACSIAEVPGSAVTLSYRSEAFTRAKAKNRDRVQTAEANGNLRVLLRSQVERIEKTHVQINQDARADPDAQSSTLPTADRRRHLG